MRFLGWVGVVVLCGVAVGIVVNRDMFVSLYIASSSVVFGSISDIVEYSSSSSAVCIYSFVVVLCLFISLRLLTYVLKSLSANCNVASVGRMSSWKNRDVAMSLSYSMFHSCSILAAVLLNLVDSDSIFATVLSIWASMFLLLFSNFVVWSCLVDRSMLLCFWWILRSMDILCSCASGVLCVPVRGEERERGRRIERVLVVSSRRCIVRFLYLLFDNCPRPSAYGKCCRLGWFVLAISAHVDSVVCVVGFRSCCGGMIDEAGLTAADSSWLVGVDGGRGSCVGGAFVLFLRRIRLATG